MRATDRLRFTDRRSAGRELAARLAGLADEDPIVLGLARGGVPVAYEVARLLGAPLDVLVACKVGAPGNPEYGIGAVAEDDAVVLDHEAVGRLRISQEDLERAVAGARAEIRARVDRYRHGRRLDLGGRTVIVVDDGLATGGTARAALRAVRAQRPRRLILAVPVGARDSVAALRKEADDVICVREPDPFWAVGAWYANFAQTPDTEVAQLLGGTATTPVVASGVGAREVRIEVGPSDHIVGDLVVPERALGIVVFAHGSGSSRMSPRNRWVATALNDGGFATLLLDLLTPAEALDRANVFDIALLADRLVAASAWLSCEPAVGKLSLGYFGASTGAGAALWAAAAPGAAVRALVSRGGRPDLAMPRLADVHAPVLLIVGGRDDVVLQLNREAQRHLGGVSELAVVPDATHLFEEPGALEEVSRLAVDWFDRHLAGQVTSSGPMR